jgi:FlaG/FlaF family flagellin (archaellin)
VQNFIKTIIDAVQTWTKKEIKNSTADWNQNDAHQTNYIKNKPDVVLKNEFHEAIDEIKATKDYIILNDASIPGIKCKIQVNSGGMSSSIISSLDDFTYDVNDDGTYTITGWNIEYMGEYSDILVIPDDENVIL